MASCNRSTRRSSQTHKNEHDVSPSAIENSIRHYLNADFGIELRGPLSIQEVEAELNRIQRIREEMFGGNLPTPTPRKRVSFKGIKLLEELFPDRDPNEPMPEPGRRWRDFKSKLNSDRSLYHFISDPLSWGGLHGREGYIIVEDNQVVDLIITALN